MTALSNQEFRILCEKALQQLRSLAPYDTGNLALNAIKMEFPSPDVCRIYVYEAIAPYMPFTTFPWLSPKWHGKKNPNEGWWENAGAFIADYIAAELGGKLRRR